MHADKTTAYENAKPTALHHKPSTHAK